MCHFSVMFHLYLIVIYQEKSVKNLEFKKELEF